MADIFISYAREDRKKVELLVKTLEAQGWSVWWDADLQSRAGDQFDEVIEKEIEAARCVIALWSKHSTESRWVRTEAGEGAERRILVPIKVQKGVKPPLAFRRLQTADLSGWRGSADNPQIVDVLSSIRGVLEGREVGEIKSTAGGSASGGTDLAALARRWWWVAAALAVAVVAWAFWPSPPGPPIDDSTKNLAVLPFDAIAVDERMGSVVAQGTTADLIDKLHKVPGLSIPPYKRVSLLTGAESYSEIGRELGVTHLLTGTARQIDESWSVTAQLSEAAEDAKIIWSLDLGSAHEADDHVVLGVAEALGITLPGADTTDGEDAGLTLMVAEVASAAPPADPGAAHLLYLEGCALLETRQRDDIDKARDVLLRATELDPTEGATWARLADAYRLRALYGVEFGATERAAALAAARRAVELDDLLPSAWATLGDTLHFEWRRAEAERAFREAIELNPGYATARQWYAQLLVLDGRVEEGLAMARKAVELDPHSAIIRSTLSNMQYFAGDYEGAVTTSREALQREPEFWLHRVDLSQALSALGRHDEAVDEARAVVEATGGAPRAQVALATALAHAGDTAGAEAIVAEAVGLSLLQRAWIHAAAGQDGAALDLLEQGLAEKESWMILAPSIPDLMRLRGEARGQRFFTALETALVGSVERE